MARDELEDRVHQRTAELEQSDQEVLERERQLRVLTEAIPLQIWAADANGSIEYCNRGLVDYIGKDLDALLGEAFFSILHSEDASLFRQGWEAARVSGGRFEIQARIRGRDGAYRWFLIRGIPQRASTGEILRWYGVHTDVEEQHKLRQQRLQAHGDLSRSARTTSMAELAASIAHEINQPLTALMTHASACRRWLRAEPPNPSRAAAAADRIVEETARAGNVVGRVRSRFSTSDYLPETTDLNELIQELGASVTRRCASGARFPSGWI